MKRDTGRTKTALAYGRPIAVDRVILIDTDLMAMSDKKTKPIQAVERAFDVLEALHRLERAGVTEVATELGIAKSTAHSHLNTLHKQEYVVKENDEYRIGLRLLGFGAHVRSQMPMYAVGKSEIKELAAETGELANLLVEEHGRGIYVHREIGKKAVHLDTYAGKRVYLHSTALGKCILAEKSEAEVDAILNKYGMPAITDRTITDRDELDAEMETIRRRGYAIDDEERLTGLRCVAAPIKMNNTVVGSISVSGPVSRIKGNVLEETIPEQVMNAASVITINLTYS